MAKHGDAKLTDTNEIGGQGRREFSPLGQRSSQRHQDCAIG
jgi:hypothetical protein